MKKIFIFLIFSLCLIIFLIKIIDNYYSPKTKEYIYIMSKQMIQRSITNTISDGILEYIDSEKLVKINYNKDTNVSDVIINTKIINEVLYNTSSKLDIYFKEHNLYILEVPIGSLISKNILSGYGSLIKIPIKQSNSYISDIKTNTVEFGINSYKVEISLNINFDCLALIPFNQTTFEIEYKFLLGSFVIMGDVPNYYYASDSNESFPYVPL